MSYVEPSSFGYGPQALAEIELDLTLHPDEVRPNAIWPPIRMRERDRQLGILRRLWSGRLDDIVPPGTDPPRIVTNLFERLPEVHSDLLVSSPLPTDPPGLEAAVEALVTNLLRSGMAWCWYDGVALQIMDPAVTYPRRDGGVVAVTRYTSETAQSSWPDRALITVVEPDGAWEQYTTEFTGSAITQGDASTLPGDGSLGELTDGPEYGMGRPPVAVPLPPRSGRWGTSIYRRLAPLVAELARRHDSRSAILDYNAAPLLTYRVADIDVDSAVLVESDAITDTPPDLWDDDGKPALNDTLTEREALVRRQLDRWRRSQSMRLADGITDIEYLTWDGDLTATEASIEQIHEELRLLSGLPSLLMGGADPVSGASLKRQHLVLYAYSSKLHRLIRAAIEEAMDIDLSEWEHPFDLSDQSGPSDTGGEPEPEQDETLDAGPPELTDDGPDQG